MPQAQSKRLPSYEAFWPFYLREHALPATRRWHYAGTALSIALLVIALATQTWWLLIIVPIAGYAFAWISHAFVERNKPATFIHPLWSLISDFRMFFLFLTGRLQPELEKAGVVDHPHAHTAE